MSKLETRTQPPTRELRGELETRHGVGVQLGHCLVASTDGLKRELICESATSAGWATIVCADLHQASVAIERRRFQLAWVDGDVAPVANLFRELCHRVVALPDVLLIVSGQENDAAEEIWARQLGVWLYLPGLSLDHGREVSQLCEQAQWVVNRKQKTS